MELKRISATTAIAIAALFLTSCAGASPQQEATPAGDTSLDDTLAQYYETPTSLAVDTPLSETPPGGIEIAYLSGGTYYDGLVIEGLTAASAELDWELTPYTFDVRDPQTVGSAGLSALDAGADVLVFNATRAELFQSTVDAAEAAGIPVIDLLTDNPEVAGVTKVLSAGYVFKEQAKLLEALVADAEGRDESANVLEITVPILSAILGPNSTGLTEALESCADCTLEKLEISAAEFGGGQIPAVVVSYLQAHPDVNYLFFDGGALGEGVANAISAAGLPEPIIYAQAATDKNMQELRTGVLGQFTGTSVVVEGWIVADVIARMEVGDDASVWTEGALPPFRIYNADNVEDLETVPQMPDGYEDMFLTMWGLG